MRISPYVTAAGFIAESARTMLRRLLIFDAEAHFDLSSGVEAGAGLTAAGFGFSLGLTGHDETGDLCFLVNVETPAGGAQLEVGLSWPGSEQRALERDIHAALVTLARGDAAGETVDMREV